MALTLEQARAKLARIEVPTIEPVTAKDMLAVERKPEVRQEAFDLLNQYELKDWTFRFNNEKRTLGRCSYAKKLITFSNFYLSNDPREITDVLRHEVAHALSWTRHGSQGRGHGPLWKQTCIEVGARPVRCNSTASTSAEPNYLVRCLHGCTFKYYRMPKNMHRRVCTKHRAALHVINNKTGTVIL